MPTRVKISDFGVIQKALASATVTFFQANEDGTNSGVQATLYAAATGTQELSNPQILSEDGQLQQDCYVESRLVCAITGISNATDRSLKKIRQNPAEYYLPITSAVYAATAATDLFTDLAAVQAAAAQAEAARDAILTDAGFIAVSADLAGDDDIGTVAANILNVNIVAADLSGDDDIGAVAGAIVNINSVATVVSDIGTLAPVAADIATLAPVATEIGSLATLTTEIEALYLIRTDITDAANNLPLTNRSATTDPTVSNDSSEGYSAGSSWINVSSGNFFVCVDASVGAAVWQDLTSAAGNTLSGLTDTSLSGLSANDFLKYTGSAWENRTPAQVRTDLGLVIGTNVQAYNVGLQAISGLTPAADRVPYFTGPSAAALATLTSFGRTLIGYADLTAFLAGTGIEAGATADQSDAEIAAAYANINGQVSAGEITAGSETALRTYSPADLVSFISQHESGGGGGGGSWTDMAAVSLASSSSHEIVLADGIPTDWKIIQIILERFDKNAVGTGNDEWRIRLRRTDDIIQTSGYRGSSLFVDSSNVVTTVGGSTIGGLLLQDTVTNSPGPTRAYTCVANIIRHGSQEYGLYGQLGGDAGEYSAGVCHLYATVAFDSVVLTSTDNTNDFAGDAFVRYFS